MKKILALLMALLMVGALLAGCSNKPAGDVKTFTVGLQGDPVSLDPAFAYDWVANPIVNQVNESLLTFDENNELKCLLCESWEAVDAVTYVYNIRNDVTFSNGEPMTMDDVMFSLERTADPDFGSYLQWMFSSVASIEKTGDWQVTITLSEPNANWQYMLATTAGSIINKKQFEELGKDVFGTASGAPLGTGAYVHAGWTMGQEVVLEKNANYWDKDQTVAMDKIVFKLIAEDTTRVTGCLNGDINFTVYTPSDMVEQIEADESLSVYSVESFGLTYLCFNCDKPPFDNPKVRQAICCAINLEDYQANLIKSAGTIGNVMPNSMALCVVEPERFAEFVESADNYAYDVERAKSLLAEAGYADGFECNVLLNQVSIRYDLALAIQEDLAAVGITLEINQVSDDEHSNQQMGYILDSNGWRMYDMLIGGWEADYPDINGNFEPQYAGYNIDQGSNAAAYNNETVTDLIKRCNSSLDPSERVSLLIEAMEIANADSPYYPLFYPVRQMTLDTHYSGFTINESWVWNMYFKDVVYTAD